MSSLNSLTLENIEFPIKTQLITRCKRTKNVCQNCLRVELEGYRLNTCHNFPVKVTSLNLPQQVEFTSTPVPLAVCDGHANYNNDLGITFYLQKNMI